MTKTTRDISGVIWDKDIPGIVAGLRAEGISEFTISDNSCGLIKKLAVFEANGAKVQGLTEIPGMWLDFKTRKPEMIPAILMKLD